MNQPFAFSSPVGSLGEVAPASCDSVAPPEAERKTTATADLAFPARRLRLAWLAVACSCLLVLIMSHSLWRHSQSAAQAQFDRRKAEITTAIQDRMDAYEQALRGGLGLFEASESVSRAEWHTYVEVLDLQHRYPGIQGMGYSLWLKPEDLAAHIAAVRAEGFADYQIRPETPRDEYTAIVYLEPFDLRNRQAFGYDMWSQQVRQAAMRRARDTGLTTISGKVTLVQEIDSDVQAGFLMYLPYYGGLQLGADTEARRLALIGFVYSPFRMHDLMRGVVGSLDDIRLTIHDGTAVSPESLMFDSASDVAEQLPAPRFVSSTELPIRGATWTLGFSSLPAFRRGDAAEAQPLIVLIAGLISCAFFGFVVWSWGATRVRAQAMAADMVASLKRQQAELLRSNEDLEQFAYVASHDLRAPLRNMNFLITWLVEDHGADLKHEALGILDDLTKCAARMDALLSSILTYSRLGNSDVPHQLINAEELVAEAVKMIAPPPSMKVTIEGTLPEFHGATARMSQVFTNLIGNAIKHHDGDSGHVVISGAVDGEMCEFRIRDDGPGIKPEFHERVFEMFKTLRSRDEVEGSGMGLSIVKKTIEQHGGRIWIEDDGAPRGTCFVFTVKKDPQHA